MLSVRRIINMAAYHRTNAELLEIWKIRYYKATGIMPTSDEYQVLHCRTCNKPHWYNKLLTGKFLTARCQGH